MSQSDDDLQALAEYETEARPPCAGANSRTGEACGDPAAYSIYLKHTHSPEGPGIRFLCEPCYRLMLELPYPIRCVHCRHRISGPGDMVKDPRKL